MVVAAGPGCKVCKRPMVPSPRRKKRTLCARRECKVEARRRAGLKGARSLWGATPRKTKRCPQCDRTKPRTREHWSPATYRDGEVWQWAQYCKPCMAALHRDQYRTKPELREKAKARARRQRERGGGRRRNPGRRRSHAPPAEDYMPRLPSAPLVALVERLAADRDQPPSHVCEALGFDERTLLEWRKGRSVLWDVADRAVLEASLSMEDLWPEVDSRPPMVVH